MACSSEPSDLLRLSTRTTMRAWSRLLIFEELALLRSKGRSVESLGTVVFEAGVRSVCVVRFIST